MPAILIVDDIEFNIVPLKIMLGNMRIPMPQDSEQNDPHNYNIELQIDVA